MVVYGVHVADAGHQLLLDVQPDRPEQQERQDQPDRPEQREKTERQERQDRPEQLLRQYMHNTEIAVTMRLSTILKTIKQPL